MSRVANRVIIGIIVWTIEGCLRNHQVIFGRIQKVVRTLNVLRLSHKLARTQAKIEVLIQSLGAQDMKHICEWSLVRRGSY